MIIFQRVIFNFDKTLYLKLDKTHPNFCDFFKFKQTAKSSGASDSNTKDMPIFPVDK